MEIVKARKKVLRGLVWGVIVEYPGPNQERGDIVSAHRTYLKASQAVAGNTTLRIVYLPDILIASGELG